MKYCFTIDFAKKDGFTYSKIFIGEKVENLKREAIEFVKGQAGKVIQFNHRKIAS